METRGLGNCRRCGHLLSNHPGGGHCAAKAKRGMCGCLGATGQEKVAPPLSHSIAVICILVLNVWWYWVMGSRL